MKIKSRELFTRPKNKDAKSHVAQKHCLGSFMSKTRVQVPPPPLIVTIQSSKKNNNNSIKDHQKEGRMRRRKASVVEFHI